MGGDGDGLGELVDLLESYVEARVEECASKEYAIVCGDGVCVASLLAKLVPAGDDCVLITPLTVIAGLARSHEPAFVGVTPDIQAMAVRKGGLAHARLADFLSWMYREELREADLVVLRRSGRECYVAAAGVKREDLDAGEVAKTLSKAIVESMVKASEWMAEAKLCSDKRECLERLLKRVKALRRCD
jgi:hypothetical protein